MRVRRKLYKYKTSDEFMIQFVDTLKYPPKEGAMPVPVTFDIFKTFPSPT